MEHLQLTEEHYTMMHARYEELVVKYASDQLSDEECIEQVQLFYELYPSAFEDLFFEGYTATPEEAYGGRASQRGVFKWL